MSHRCLFRRRVRRFQHLACLWHVWLGRVVLFSGCADSSFNEPTQLSARLKTSEAGEAWALAPHAEELPVAEQVSATVDPSEIEPVQNSQFWAFSDDTRLVCLPGVEHAELPVAEIADSEDTANEEPLGILLRPLADNSTSNLAPGKAEVIAEQTPLEDVTSEETVNVQAEPPVEEDAQHRNRAIEMPAYDELSAEERHLLDLIERETLDATTGEPTDARLDQVCRERIAAAYNLSQRGASYAAREQLIEVLRRVSQAKDNRDGTRSRSESLAAGLRALEEADDFMPRGSQLEGEMKLEIVCAAHRTPLSRELDLSTMLPSQMMERYNRYAQIKLAVAVAGEPAGSMALYSLGKLNSQLAATETEQHPQASRRAVAFQQAALLAHNENYLAAHELGVLLAETGHYPEAQHLLLQVAVEQPNATVFRNLARVHEALGNATEARLYRTEAEHLARQGSGPRPDIAWVSQNDFSRNQMNTFAPQVASNSNSPPVAWR